MACAANTLIWIKHEEKSRSPLGTNRTETGSAAYPSWMGPSPIRSIERYGEIYSPPPNWCRYKVTALISSSSKR